MRRLFYTISLLLLPLLSIGQTNVKESIEKYKHTLTFIVDGKVCMEETYLVVDGEFVADGVWKMYDSKGENIYLIEYYKMGRLIDRIRLTEGYQKQD